MNCPSCHAPNPGDSRFCNRCGTLLAAPQAAAQPPQPAPVRPAPANAMAAGGPAAYVPGAAPAYATGAPPAYSPPGPPAYPAPAYAPPAYAPPAYVPPAGAQPAYAPPAGAAPAYPPAAQATRPQATSAGAGPSMAYAGGAGAGAAASATFNGHGLIQRIIGITLRPSVEWSLIAAEPPSIGRVVIGCVMPLAAIQALLQFIHMAVIGVSVPFAGSVRMPMAASLTAAVMGFVFAIVGMFLFAVIVNAWAPFFAGRRSLGEALKVAGYTSVPAWVGAFFGILPVLGVLIGLLAAIYCIYVLYLGLPTVMRAPRERATGYTVAVILTGLVVGVLLGATMAAVGGVGRFGMTSREANAEQGAAMTGNILGNMLGTDDKGKAALGAAIGNLARAGQQMEDAQRAAGAQAPAQTPAEAAAQAQRAAAQTGNVIGGMLGTDAQGRSALGAALGNLAQAGQQGGSPTAAGGTTPTANAAAPMTADQAANTGAAVGGLLTALGGALGGSHRFAPVDFHVLQSVLPASVDGMARGATEGENKQAMGVHASSAGAVYTGPAGSNIHVKISDVSGVSGLIDIAGSLDHTSESESSTGFERDVSIGGRTVHEKFTNAGKQGEVQVIVAKRFSVDVDGSGVDIAALEQALGQIDLGRLESMKNANAQN